MNTRCVSAIIINESLILSETRKSDHVKRESQNL